MSFAQSRRWTWCADDRSDSSAATVTHLAKTTARWAGLILLLGANGASALELDYYTYNGFDQTVNAFEKPYCTADVVFDRRH